MQSAQTPRTDANLTPSLAVVYRPLVEIQLPVALRTIVSMTDAMTELRTSATNVARSCHYIIPLCSVSTKPKHTTSRELSQTGSNRTPIHGGRQSSYLTH